MLISAGDRLGPYEILASLGEGGMGKVYRAHDPRLHREVAVKVAAAEFNNHAGREARLAAALNHSNICHIYDVGPSYLVMELVEGPTLAERLRQGALPLDEALGIARQIASALQAAHEKGIVHRDLKPANIKITPGGTVKVLDFGLAKAAEEAAPAGSPEDSPTVSLELATRAGVIIGTVAYMAPEQARGKPVDKRADIWAFGVVLYEMLAGRRPFQGETVSDTLSAVLTREPEWHDVPPQTERLLRRCLAKDPQQRLRDIGDARFLLEDEPRAAVLPAASAGPWRIGAAVLALLLAAALSFLWFSSRRPAPVVMRLSVDLGENAALAPRRGASMALSPDGSRLVYLTGHLITDSHLALRRLEQAKAEPLAGTDGAEAPFFSPDGNFIAFFADGKLKKMDIAGGTPIALCDVSSQRGGSWGADGNIVFAANNTGGLWRVPDRGGAPQPVTSLARGEITHRYPQVLPGARAVLFMDNLNLEGEGSIEALSLQTGRRITLVAAGAYPRYLPDGRLVYMHRGTLFAAPMDARRLELTGPAAPLLEDVSFEPGTGTAAFTFSQSGLFAYVPADPGDRMRPLGVLDQTGKLELLPVPRGRYVRARVSPDGTRLAVAISTGPAVNIWLYEWGTRRFSRLAFLKSNSNNPVWTPDGKYLVFSTDTPSPGPGIYWMRADGEGEPGRLVEGSGLVPTSVSAHAGLVYQVSKGPHAGLWRLPVDWSGTAGPKPGAPERFADPAMAIETPASFSPDGRWIAYSSAPSGLPEIFVRPFPGPGGPWQISNGGTSAVWSRNGRELFYQSLPDYRIMVAAYSVANGSFSPAPPLAWNDLRVERFDLMPDGNRAVVVPAAEQKEPTHATFLLNFLRDLRK